MSVLKQRFCSHMRLVKGGAVYVWHILDGDEVVGTKTESRQTSRDPWTRVYSRGQNEYPTAAEFVAAYNARPR